MILTKDIQQLQDLNYWNIFIGLIIILAAIVGLYTLIEKICGIFGKPMKWIKINNQDHIQIEKINLRQDDIMQKIDALVNATMETMCDRIEQRCKYYINDLHGIPEDEVSSFTSMFNAYKAIGGNHGAEAKYNYCINNLPLIPISTTAILKSQNNNKDV